MPSEALGFLSASVPTLNRKELSVNRLALVLTPLLIAGLMGCSKSGTVTSQRFFGD